MEEQDIDIINKETKKEQIINFINKNKKKFIAVILILIFIPIVYYSFDAYKNNEKKKFLKNSLQQLSILTREKYLTQ